MFILPGRFLTLLLALVSLITVTFAGGILGKNPNTRAKELGIPNDDAFEGFVQLGIRKIRESMDPSKRQPFSQAVLHEVKIDHQLNIKLTLRSSPDPQNFILVTLESTRHDIPGPRVWSWGNPVRRRRGSASGSYTVLWPPRVDGRGIRLSQALLAGDRVVMQNHQGWTWNEVVIRPGHPSLFNPSNINAQLEDGPPEYKVFGSTHLPGTTRPYQHFYYTIDSLSQQPRLQSAQ